MIELSEQVRVARPAESRKDSSEYASSVQTAQTSRAGQPTRIPNHSLSRTPSRSWQAALSYNHVPGRRFV